MIRLASLADTHICTRHPRWSTLRDVLRDIVRSISDARPDVILHAGDLGEPHPSADDLDAIASFVQALGDVASVVVCGGNHDDTRYWPTLDRIATRHPVRWVTVPQTFAIVSPYPSDDVVDLMLLDEVQDSNDAVRLAIHCLPWPSKGRLLSRLADLPPSETSDQIAAELLRGWFQGCRPLRESVGYAGPSVLLGHLDVHGATLSDGQPLATPGLKVGVEDLLAARCDAVCLGHIHARQEIDGHSEITYAGSPCRLTWGEAGDDGKGWSLIEIDEKGAAVRAMDVPSPHLWTCTAEWGGSYLRLTEDLEGGPGPNEEVRIRYEVDEDQRDAARADEPNLLARLDWTAARVTWDRVTRPSLKARAPEIATESDPVAMHARWRAAEGIEVTPERAERIAGMIREAEGTP